MATRAAKVRGAAAEVVRYLRTEQIGGLILLGATVLALAVANSGLADAYQNLAGTVIGPHALHLDLAVEDWAKDGLLAFFFLVAGLELKRELVEGELRDPRRALLPIAGAIGGMVAPALVFLAVAAGAPGAGDGWAVPTATDIAFALAVLAITARTLPPSVRIFLLSLAIVDDLGAILLIAVLFTTSISWWPLFGAALAVGAYALLQRRRVRGWWIYWPLGISAWALVHASGVHATVAGVAIGLATRIGPGGGDVQSEERSDEVGRRRQPGPKRAKRANRQGPASEVLEHRLQPFSAGVCVPVFAFFAAGVAISSDMLRAFATDRVAWAVVAGLVVGKTVGVFSGALVAVRSGAARLPAGMTLRDLFAVSVLTGCGFTVSLLIAELAFAGGGAQDRVKGAVLLGSLLASLLAALMLRRRVRALSP
ncbi:Na+/H+ antiporter NhaA [Phytohabitans rumicis]|uniref:Na+/H+ antiporter NhaA n=1 Tax=Phytohabitans rumicis TaxID=1076125 RepID=UPI0031E57CAF